MAMVGAPYPITIEIDPPAPQNRLSVLLRLIYAIPALIVAAVIGFVAQIVTFIAWFAILFTGTYPEGMLRFAIGALRWGARVNGYVYLLTDKYPPFSGDDDPAYPIRVHAIEQSSGRNRLTTFFRILLAIPHFIILGIIGYIIGVVVFIAWVVAIFSGRVPDGLHNFTAGFVRWQTRANAYMMLLTDEYPPFSMS